MPSAVLRCTAIFGSDAGKGWSESHDRLFAEEPTDLLPHLLAFKLLIDQKRVPLLGRDCYVKALRVAYRSASGAIKSSPFKYQPYQRPGNDKRGSAPAIAAKVRMGTSTNADFSDIYLRGFWDTIEEDEQLVLNVGDGAIWAGLLDQYVAALVGSQPAYGWSGINEALTSRGEVTAYSVPLNTRPLFTVNPTNGVTLAALVNKIVPFNFAKLNNSRSVLNRSLVVKVLSETEVQTTQPIAATAFTGEGTYIAPVKQFFAYTGKQYVILGRRAMGRPIGDSPARLKARPRT